MNKALAESEGDGDDGAARAAFAACWKGLHRIRTALSLAAFVLLSAMAVPPFRTAVLWARCCVRVEEL
ncbi:hypothetical protein ACFYXM_29480 [Streptomyces sp. NPDC002476]|uniref:hypothetical protein n=1 Tax=Streptomyces sp. NPDC002476 TaxID=3364648 RepID=UPI003683FABF